MKLLKLFKIITLLLIVKIGSFELSINIYGQSNSYKVSNLSIENGLASSTVFCSIKDSKGFVWFGTQLGLNKFDGKNVVTFKKSNDTMHSISNNWVTSLLLLNDTTMLVGTQGGINKLDLETEKFNQLDVPDNLDINTWSLVQDNEGNIWVAALQNGLLKLDKDGNFIEHFGADDFSFIDREKELNIRKTFAAPEHLYILTFNGRVFKLDCKNNKIQDLSSKLYPAKNQKVTSRSILLDNNKNLWIGNVNGFKVFDKNLKIKEINLSDNTDQISDVRDIKNIDGKVYLATNSSGLFVYDPHQNKLSKFSTGKDLLGHEINNFLMNITMDRDGIFWLCTVGSGIQSIHLLKPFHKIKFGNKKNHDFNENIRDLAEDKWGHIWISTFSGLYQYHKTSDGREKLQKVKSAPIIPTFSLAIEKDNLLWVGTTNGIYQVKMDSIFDNYRVIKNKDISLATKGLQILDLYIDANGTVWIGTPLGMKFTRKVGNKYKLFDAEYFEGDSIKQITDITMEIFPYGNDELLVGTVNNGMYIYNKMKKKVRTLADKGTIRESVNENIIADIIITKDKRIALGGSKGLFIISKDEKNFEFYNEEDGLANEVVYSILEDSSGNLWMSTNRGISKFDSENKSFLNYSEDHGLTETEFNDDAALRSNNGNLYFGSISGGTYFDPNQIGKSSDFPLIVLTEFKIQNENQKLEKHISYTDRIEIPSSSSFFTFGYKALDFTYQKNIKYRYRLKGYNDSWIVLDNNSDITFTNLEGKDYTLEISSTNSQNIWNPKPLRVSLTVIPPFYKTNLFYILVTLVLLLIGTFIYQLRIKIIKNKNLELEKWNTTLENEISIRKDTEEQLLKEMVKSKSLEKMKQNFLALMSHEIRTPLGGIKSFSEILKEELSEKYENSFDDYFSAIDNSVKRIIRTMDMILLTSDIKTGTFEINTANFNLFEEIVNPIIEDLDSLAKTNNNKISVISNFDEIKIISDKFAFVKVFSNLVDNALKYTNDGIVKVQIDLDENENLTCSIVDTGIGIDEKYLKHLFEVFSQEDEGFSRKFEGTGLGLALVKDLCDLMGLTINVESKKNEGSTFVITIPKEKVQTFTLNTQ